MKALIFSSSETISWKIIGAMLVLACAVVAATHAQTPSAPPAPIAASSTHATVAKPAAKSVPVIAKNTAKPYWTDLTPAQHMALAPLAGEWDRLGRFNKEKWLELSKKFPTMSPTEQARLHDRMRDWVKLTPDQRRTARENYARVKKLTLEERALQWQRYQQLSEEKKKQLAESEPARKPIVNPPLTHNKSTQAKPVKPVPAKQPVPQPEGIQPSTVQPAPAKP
jgi:hypothetical protein